MIFGGASCTTLRVGFSQNDWSLSPLRKRSCDPKSLLDGGKLAADPHLHVVGLPRGRSLGMKADEIEMRTNFSVRVILLVRAMFQERAKKVRGFGIPRARAVRPSDPRLGKRPQHRLD